MGIEILELIIIELILMDGFLCPVHLIFEVFYLASNIEIVVELLLFIYFLLFGWGKFNKN
jgi:hypothetical protein